MHITTLAESLEPDGAMRELRRLFFLTSTRQRFDGEGERREFFRRWTGYYLEQVPHRVFLSHDDTRLVGYLTGCDDSQAPATALGGEAPGYTLFADLFDRFPAHLHINVDPKTQGLGVGRALIDAYVEALRSQGVAGVHIVTAPGGNAIGFYDKLGFTVRVERDFGDRRLLFMGLSLASLPTR